MNRIGPAASGRGSRDRPRDQSASLRASDSQSHVTASRRRAPRTGGSGGEDRAFSRAAHRLRRDCAGNRFSVKRLGTERRASSGTRASLAKRSSRAQARVRVVFRSTGPEPVGLSATNTKRSGIGSLPFPHVLITWARAGINCRKKPLVRRRNAFFLFPFPAILGRNEIRRRRIRTDGNCKRDGKGKHG